MMMKVLAIGQHAVDRRRLQNVDHIVGLHERRRGEAEVDQEQDEAREGEQLLPRLGAEKTARLAPCLRRLGYRRCGIALCCHALIVHDSRPPSLRFASPVCMMRSWLAPAADSSSVIRPAHMTTIRSLMRRISRIKARARSSRRRLGQTPLDRGRSPNDQLSAGANMRRWDRLSFDLTQDQPPRLDSDLVNGLADRAHRRLQQAQPFEIVEGEKRHFARNVDSAILQGAQWRPMSRDCWRRRVRLVARARGTNLQSIYRPPPRSCRRS